MTYKSQVAYDGSDDAVRNKNVNSLNLQFVEESLFDGTGLTTGTYYYPASYGLSMAGYKDASVTGKLVITTNTATLTIEGTNDEDSSGDWHQVYAYDDIINTTVNSWAVTNGTKNFAISLNECNFKYLRFKVVTTGTSGAVVLKARRKAL
jgi:hypothetical protein